MDDIEKQFQKETGIKHPTIEELSSRSMLVYTEKFNKWLKSKIKNLSEGSEPPYPLLSDVADRIDNRVKFIAVSNTNVIHWPSISDTPIGAMMSVKHDLYEEIGDAHNFDANEWQVIKIKIEIVR